MTIATARGIGLLVVAAIIFMAGWNANGWRLGKQHAEYREAAALALAKQQQLTQAQTEYHIAEMAMLDRRHTREIVDARTENERLLAAVRTGERRLSVRTRCPAVSSDGSASGMDDAAPRAELDPAAAGRILSVGTDGDDAIRQLTALQDYVERICINGG